MFKRDRWNEIIQALTSNWVRTILTALGVAWGIFIFMLFLAGSKGLSNGVKSGFAGMSANSMFMWTQSTSMSYKGLPKGRRFEFKLSDVQAIKEEVQGLKYVSPRNQLGGYGGANNVTRGLETGAYNVYGDYPEYFAQNPMDMLDGRFINHGDLNEKRKVAVIGTGVRSELYKKGEETLGTYIKINGVNFKVVGVYQVSNSQGDPEEDSKQIFVPFTTFSQAFNRGDRVGWMAITAQDGYSITALKEDIKSVVKKRHDVHPEDDRAIGNFDLFEQFNKISQLFIILDAVGFFVGIVILMAGVIGVCNIMLIVVKERTKEIGIRRALGATPWNIRGQVLFESVVLTVLSGMMGIVAATGVIALVNNALDASKQQGGEVQLLNPSVEVGTVIFAFGILIFFGLLFGLLPAQKAIGVKPVDALRTE
jgi:putative ABC transport system permease protein